MSNQPLPQSLQETAAFFDPENLARLALKYEGEVALLVIDVQKQFCDPADREKRGNAETVEISERIQSLVPEFRKAGIPVYAIFYSPTGRKKRFRKIDFYKFKPDAGDTVVGKYADSAFEGSNIADLLHGDNKKLLLACGFNLNACVKSTVKDARAAGFEVCLLRDLAGNDCLNRDYADSHLRDMQKAGTVIASSQAVLKQLRAPSL